MTGMGYKKASLLLLVWDRLWGAVHAPEPYPVGSVQSQTETSFFLATHPVLNHFPPSSFSPRAFLQGTTCAESLLQALPENLTDIDTVVTQTWVHIVAMLPLQVIQPLQALSIYEMGT